MKLCEIYCKEFPNNYYKIRHSYGDLLVRSMRFVKKVPVLQFF